MTRTTSTVGRVSREEIEHVLEVLLLVCTLLKALEPILKRLVRTSEKAS